MDLFLFTVDAHWGADVVAAGAAGIVVDWERRGKARRQLGEGTQINSDTPEDLSRVRAATPGRVLCRINGFGPWTGGEVDDAIARGADELLLPMVRTPEDVDRTLDLVAGRCGLGILIETQDAVLRAAELARRPLSRIYVGLNDLRIDRRSTSLFGPLVDGTVDAVRAEVHQAFGVAGLTLPGGGVPVPGSLLAAELVRLDTHFTFLRRSFIADMAGRDPFVEVPRLRESVAALRGADPVVADDRRRRFVAAVTGVPVGGAVPVALPRVRALVTGAGGFVGRHLVARLRTDGWDVTALTRRDVDLTDPAAAAAAVRAADPDVVFSLAAARAKRTAAERAATIAVNTSPWLVDALPDRCRTVVRLGSSTEYAASPRPLAEDAALEPRGFFGATKAAGSLLLQAAAAERGVRAAVLRAFQVYGPGDHPTRLVPVVLDAARTGAAVPLPARLSRRDWVWVGDVVDACARAAADDALPQGVVLNVGTGVQTSTEELVATAERVTGRSIATLPGAHPGRDWDTADWVCDPSAASRLLSWTPTVDLAEGLARTWSTA